MPSPRKATNRFATLITVVEGGSGSFSGVVTEPDQSSGSMQRYSLPRRILRTDIQLTVKAGMVVRDTGGTTYLVGLNGESAGVFNSFVMVPASREFTWQKRTKIKDPVTKLDRDEKLVDQPLIWGSYEPQQEASDGALGLRIETGKFLTNAPVQRDDMVDGKRVTRVDEVLGMNLLALG